MEEIVKKYWFNSIISASLLLALLNIYEYYYLGMFDIYAFNKSLANASIILVGLSFSFSGLAHFFKFQVEIYNHRKYLGLVGFWLGLAHGIFSTYSYLDLNSPKPSFDFLYMYNFFGISVSNIWSFASAVIALVVLVIMAFISNKFAAKALGKNWRPMLRIGYFAYLLLIVHFSIKRFNEWTLWFKYQGMIPMTLIVVAFAWSVILLRIILFISERYGKKDITKQP